MTETKTAPGDQTGGGEEKNDNQTFGSESTGGVGANAKVLMPVLMAAELLRVDPSSLQSDLEFAEPDDLVKAELVAAKLGRLITSAEVDKWCAEKGVHNHARAAQERRAKAAADRAAVAETEHAKALAEKETARRWAGIHFAAAELDPDRSLWERRLAAHIAYDNSQMARSKPFRTVFTGSDALGAGAAVTELEALGALTREQILELGGEGWAMAEAHALEAKARGKAIALERSGARTPLEDCMFDFDRDFAELRAPEMLIPRLIESGTPVQVIAKPNVGKTFLVTSWACELAAQGRDVVYVVADDSRYQYIRRVLGWCAAHEEEPRDIFAHLHLFTRAAQFADKGDMDAVAAKVIEHGAVMVVFDTQHQCSDGVVENSNDDAHVVTAALVRLTALGPAVVVVHHTGDGATGRGAKSVHGFLTTVLSVSDIKEDGQRYLEVTATKQKNMERGEPVRFPLDYVEIPEDLRGTVITDARRGAVIADAHRGTLVARTRLDPFDSPGTLNRSDLISTIRRYCVLSALRSSPKAMPVTRIAKFTREAAMPMLSARNLLTAKGNRPRGFVDQEITELLVELAKPENGLADDADSTARTAYYLNTKEGDSEMDRLAAELGINSDLPENTD